MNPSKLTMSKKRTLESNTLSFEEILALVESKDKDGLKTAFKQDCFDVNMTDHLGNTVLHYATIYDEDEILELFVNHPQINVDAKDEKLMTPLMIAAHYGKVNAVKLLLEKGADASCSDKYGRTALIIASDSENFECVETLLKSENCAPCTQDEDGKNALMYGIDNFEIVNTLVEVSDLAQIDHYRRTALHYACESGSLDTVKLLIEKNIACIDMGDDSNVTPLHVALSNSFLEIADYLIEKGASTSLKDSNGHPACHYAAKFDDSETFLEKYEPEEQYLDEMFKLLLKFARCKTLKAYAAKCIKKYPNGPKILNLAVSNAMDKNQKMFKYLLSAFYEQNADLRPTDAHIKKARSVIFKTAVKKKHNLVIDYFLRQGLEPNEAEDGESYLFQACREKNASLVKALLKLGADTRVRDDEGFTPLFFSARMQYTDVFLELLKVDNDLSQRTNDGLTPFLAACKSGNLVILNALIKAGACLTDVDNRNRNCLHFAAYHYESDLMIFLFRKIDKQDFITMMTAGNNEGRSPLDILVQRDFKQIRSEIFKVIHPALKDLIVSPNYITIKDSSQEICLICRDEFVTNDKAVELSCKHLFHEDCYGEWSKQKEKCPYCQRPAYGVKK